MKEAGLVAIPFVVVLTVAAMSNWDHPPIDSTQVGYRGTGMVQIDNPRTEAKLAEQNQVWESYGRVEPGGPPASEAYENVQVLGNLSQDQFDHLMLSITTWVAPEEGCAYCHNEENLAEDSVYTKIVSRRMIQMTQAINSEWSDHVGGAGVNCYTCHRGLHVPQYIWVDEDHQSEASGGFSAKRNNQNLGVEVTGYSSLPYDALQQYLTKDDVEIRVAAVDPLPFAGEEGISIQKTESTYSMMMHMSQGLGVNCTYCHNSRAFGDWEQSSPRRMTAWHGIEMVQNLNEEYLIPLQSELPENRLGEKGDAPKAMCTTCHQGIPKPLYGANALEDHPELGQPLQ